MQIYKNVNFLANLYYKFSIIPYFCSHKSEKNYTLYIIK